MKSSITLSPKGREKILDATSQNARHTIEIPLNHLWMSSAGGAVVKMPPTTSAANTGATSSFSAVTDATSTSSIAASTFSVANVAVDTDVTVVTSTVRSSPRKKAKFSNDAVAMNNSHEISKAPHNSGNNYDNTNTEGRIKDEQMAKKINSFLLEQNEIARKEKENQDFCAICDDGGELICCDHCDKVYHAECLRFCHRIDAATLPDIWACPSCTTKANENSSKPHLPNKAAAHCTAQISHGVAALPKTQKVPQSVKASQKKIALDINFLLQKHRDITKKLIDKATVRGDASVPENKMDLARTKTLGLLRSAINSSSLLPDIQKNLYNEEAMVHMIKESESNAGKWQEAEILLQSALNTHRDETKQLLDLTAARGESMVSTVSMANARARNIAYMNVANKKLCQLNVQFYRERELWDKMVQAESDGVQLCVKRMEGDSKNTTADTNSQSSNLNGRGPVTNHVDLTVGNSTPGTLGAVGRAEQAGKHNSSRAKIIGSTIHSAAGSTGMAREMSLTHGNMHSSATANDRPLVHHAVANAPQLAQTAPEFTMLNVEINELRRRCAAQLNHAAIEKQRLEREIQNLRKLKESDERRIAFQNAQLSSASSRNDADHARKIEKLTAENSHLSIRNTALVSKAMQLESDVSSLATTTNKMISMVSKYAEKVQSDDSDYNAADSKLRSHVGTLLETVKETFVVISTRVERIRSGLTNETQPENRQENNVNTNTKEVPQAEKNNFSTYEFASL